MQRSCVIPNRTPDASAYSLWVSDALCLCIVVIKTVERLTGKGRADTIQDNTSFTRGLPHSTNLLHINQDKETYKYLCSVLKG